MIFKRSCVISGLRHLFHLLFTVHSHIQCLHLSELHCVHTMSSLCQGPLLLHLLLALLLTHIQALSSSSSSPRPNPRAAAANIPHQSSASNTASYPFQSFQFDKSTGICRNPSSFRCSSSKNCKGNNNHSSSTNHGDKDDNNKDDQFFVLRNVPGDGDCIFHAVLSSVFISMGFMNPDATFAKSDSLVSSMALEMRRK